MKYYVTFKKTQNFTYVIEADSKREAIELGAFKASSEEVAYDVSDAEYKSVSCISHMDFLLYNRQERDN